RSSCGQIANTIPTTHAIVSAIIRPVRFMNSGHSLFGRAAPLPNPHAARFKRGGSMFLLNMIFSGDGSGFRDHAAVGLWPRAAGRKAKYHNTPGGTTMWQFGTGYDHA